MGTRERSDNRAPEMLTRKKEVVLMRRLILLLLSCYLSTGAARAQSLDKEMSVLAASLTKALVAQGSKNVAAIDFTDLQGQPTELGRFLSEQLSVEMVLAGGVSMLDRANIKSILAEHKLTEEGLVNPANAKKLGEFAGVDVILIGNVTILDGVVLTVKGISTESAKIVAAGRITFPKTADIQQLLNRGVSSATAASSPTPTAAGTGSSARYNDSTAIATKDIGSLRVVLKSLLPMNIKDQYGRSMKGIRCAFEFVSLETQRPILVAMNALPDRTRNPPGGIGDVLRSTMVDESGGLWPLHSSDVAGMSIVSVGQQGLGAALYDPAEIVTVLSRRDELNADVAVDPVYHGEYRFIFGRMNEMSPGQSLTVTLSFIQDANDRTSVSVPKVFQIASEIVVGVVTDGGKRSYSLFNLTFDRVSLPLRE